MCACACEFVRVCVKEERDLDLKGTKVVEEGGERERETECVCVHVCVHACV